MKKRSIKSLKLNKKSISKLDANTVDGGAFPGTSWVKMCGSSWDVPCNWTDFLCPFA
ncbi:MAG: hypothetical protein AAF611_12310 [Bacteroidota bacterium]